MKVSHCLGRLCRLPARRLGRTAIAWQCGAILLATGPMSAFGAETTPLDVSVSAQSVESGLAGNMSGLEASSRKRDPNKLGLPEMLTIVRATHPAVTSRQADVDATDAVGVATGPEGLALVLTEQLDSGNYETRLYRYQGSIVEEYARADSAFTPQKARQIVASERFDFTYENSLLTVHTDQGSTSVALRSVRGGS